MTAIGSYGVSLVTAPTEEPVTTAEARSHLRLDDTDFDTQIANLVKAARGKVEAVTARQLVTATYDLTLDALPVGTATTRLPFGQLQSVTSVTYLDTAGASTTWSSSDYIVSTAEEPGGITPAYGIVWPSARVVKDAATVRFVCGYGGASDVPDGLKHAILLLVAHWFENAEAVTVGLMATETPLAFDALCAPYLLGDYFTWYGQAD